MTILPLKLSNVWFRASAKGSATPMPLIKELSLEFTQGPKTIIIGPNGAGKSLLLRLCHGLIKPSDGAIEWAKPDAQKHQAMVFQRPVMLRRTASANIHFALSLRHMNKTERRIIVDDVLAKTGLSRFADTQAHVLSFGEQQRLALARVWALQPEVLFLDEPTASLDPSATHQIEQLISAIQAQGTKIIMTTHDLGQAKRLADEVVFLHRGRLLEQADASIFFDQPQNKLAQSFIRGELLWWKRGEGPRQSPKHRR